MKKNEVWIVQLECATKRCCKVKFSNSELWELSDAVIAWNKAAILDEEVKGKTVHEWFGVICAILDEHKCKNLKRAMNLILTVMFYHMRVELEEYVNHMLDEMEETNNDKN